MELTLTQVVFVCGAWIIYGLLHSFTASLGLKHWVARHWPERMPLYRLLFNLVSVLTLIPLLWLIFLWQGPYLWQWSGGAWFIANGLALLAIGGFVWSLRFYDGDEFLGLRQLRDQEQRVEDQERFYISPLHRYVRHPWYCLGLVIIWTRDMDEVFLLSALLMTGYFIIGSRFEEAKLLIYHGERYRTYKHRVPGLFPLPWRYLTQDEAAALMNQ